MEVTFFNYKGFFSIVLFATVYADYYFTYVAVGCQRRLLEGEVFEDQHSKNNQWDDGEIELNIQKPHNLLGGK